MHGLTDGHHLHSYVLLFLCLYYMFAYGLELGNISSLIWAREDVQGAQKGCAVFICHFCAFICSFCIYGWDFWGQL